MPYTALFYRNVTLKLRRFEQYCGGIIRDSACKRLEKGQITREIIMETFRCSDITRNIRRNVLYLLHLLSMTVKQVTQPLTHVLIGLLS